MANNTSSTQQGSSSTPAAQPVPVVAIGASAGGLAQIKLLLSHMPTDSGAAFVVIQHLDPAHTSQLAELLANVSTLPVVTIADDMPAQANRVHVLPPGQSLSVNDAGVLQLNANQPHAAVPTLIDHCFRELAAARGRRAVGIILTGNGSDGALGLKAIRSAGGLAMAQHPDDAEFDAMPRAAAEHASPDCLLATADLIAPLCNHLRLNLNRAPATAAANDSDGDADDNANGNSDNNNDTGITDAVLTAVLGVLREYGSYDFHHHKPTMLKRRLQRRMALNGITSTASYIRRLRHDDTERSHLCNDFLISVTDFFREPDSYVTLDKAVIRKLLHHRSVDAPLRVWVPGCATGEEAYSIAMLIAEAIEATGRDYRFIVFATDIDERALNHARAGLYPESVEADLSEQRLRMFFNKVDTHYQIKRSLRERVVFAPQSVTDDPPYSRLDLISCRNLLIYLNSETQQRLITLFHFALKETGFLFLGSSETVGNSIDLFEALSKEDRIYRRLTTNRKYQVDFPTPHNLRGDMAAGYAGSYEPPPPRPRDAEQIARDILLTEHVPASVLINRKLEILCSYGPTREFLSLPPGQSSLALLDMVHSEYRSHLRAVTHRAIRHDEQSDTTTTVRDRNDQSLLITARPLRQPEQARGLVLVTFERVYEAAASLEHLTSSDLEQQLAEELDATRNELHGTITALEESNEDLKGSNEQIMSMNEELQSTNEELETSKEELQSVNEELTTVNAELESKVAELEAAHDDLSNLFAGTQVATLFLDRGMRIKRFTPAIRDLLSLISSDVGRPLADMTLKFTDPELLADADRVLDELTPREAEVAAEGERWYQRRIMPYRTHDDVIKGVVITFADITEVRNAMLLAREHETRLDLAISALTGGMWEMAIDPHNPDQLPDTIYLSARLKALLGYDDEQLPSSLTAWTERIVAQDRAMFGDVARRRRSDAGAPVHYRIRHRDGSLRWFASYGRLITDHHGRSQRWLGIDCDITNYKQATIRARHVQAQLQLLADALPQQIVFIDREQIIHQANVACQNWFARNTDALLEHSVTDVFGPTAAATLAASIDTALHGKATSCDLVLMDREQHEHSFQVSHIPHRGDDRVLGCYLLLTDMTLQRTPQVDEQEQQSRLAYIYRMAMIGEMASTLAHDINQPLSAISSYAGALTRMVHAGKPEDDTVPIIRKIASQVERTIGIVEDVRGLVGRTHDGNDAIDLNEQLRSAVAITASQAHRYNIDTRVTEHTPLPAVNADPVQIQQILVNLINNAIEAMRDADGTRALWLTTHTTDADTHVQVEVTDSGAGLPTAKLESIFQSFHSTKLNGMGMGLAISRSIAEWHGGRLWAESEPGHGATFYLNLPVQNPKTQSAADASSPEP